ncbi:U1 small nuclear ribonucleoprotein 70 kDa, partial [Sapajus apella]|uniref:U1 small nuclear ribonucleoprotein 70 kDa n=1 Tax=Sapajus apella TaxID=9515 RepID=A0A6J3H8P7_SAPAP
RRRDLRPRSTPCSSRWPRPRGFLSSGLVRSLCGRGSQADADALGVEAKAGVLVAEGPPQPPRASGPTPDRGGRRAASELGKMTQFLPPNLLALFAPRDPIPYLPPLEKLPHEKHHNQPYCGIAPYIREFEDPRDAPPPTRAETREERMERKRREKIERRQQEVETELKMCTSLIHCSPLSSPVFFPGHTQDPAVSQRPILGGAGLLVLLFSPCHLASPVFGLGFSAAEHRVKVGGKGDPWYLGPFLQGRTVIRGSHNPAGSQAKAVSCGLVGPSRLYP